MQALTCVTLNLAKAVNDNKHDSPKNAAGHATAIKNSHGQASHAGSAPASDCGWSACRRTA